MAGLPGIFTSFDHGQDDYWAIRFVDLFHEIFDIHSTRSIAAVAEDGPTYIRELIDQGYVADGTVVVVLLGTHTYARSRVDWEISAGLEPKRSRASGVLGLRLPVHPDFGKAAVKVPQRIPKRLEENIRSGYSALYDWTESPQKLQGWVSDALRSASRNGHLAVNSAEPLKRDILR